MSAWTDFSSLFAWLPFFERPAWQLWVVVTILLVLGEVVTSGFFLLALAPGALLAAWVAGLGFGLQLQLVGFVAGTLVGLFLIRPFFLQRGMNEGEPTNVEALMGRTGLVVESIPRDGIGRVRVQSEEWRATAPEELCEDDAVVVVGIEGNTLTVERCED